MIRIQDPADFRAALCGMRKHAGLSQRNLAGLAGVTHMTISNVELGKTGTTLHALLGIAHALGYDLALIPREDT